MIKLSFKSKVFLFLSILALSQETHALLQGNRVIFVDDYNDENSINQLGGENRGEVVKGEGAFKKRGASLSLNYEMDESAPFAYFWTGLGKKDPAGGRSEFANLSQMSYLSFWMKLDEQAIGQALDFFIEIHEDTDGDKRFVLGPDVLGRVRAARFSGKDEEREWRKFVIPFSQLRNVRHWDRILEIAFILESKPGNKKGKLFLDDVLFGSNYPEGVKGREFSMQNRVSSFKIGNRIANPQMKLNGKLTPLTLTLTFVDPYLEEIRFEESRDGGQTWQTIRSFYDHSRGGVYTADWNVTKESKINHQGVFVRAIGMNILGGEISLGGPYHLSFN